jgi:hypothetical protein
MHDSLKSFRADHGHEQVDEEQQGNDADNDGFHGCLKLIAETHVESANDEKHDHNADKD